MRRGSVGCSGSGGRCTPGFIRLRKWIVFLAPFLFAGCSRERFTHVDNQNPYIMFDRKTAQSCWAGPPENVRSPASGEFGEGELTPEESAELQGLDTRPTNTPHRP